MQSSRRSSSAKTSLTGHDLRAGDTCIRHLAYVSHQRISKCTSSFQLRNLYHHKSCYRWRWCLQAAQVESSSELSSSIEPASPFTTMEKSAARLNTAERLSALGIPELSQAALFDDHHIDDLNLLLLAYFPFGCVVAALRMALWVVGVALDAPWFRQPSVIGAWVYLLGVSVTWTDQQNIPQVTFTCLYAHFMFLLTGSVSCFSCACEHPPGHVVCVFPFSHALTWAGDLPLAASVEGRQ